MEGKSSTLARYSDSSIFVLNIDQTYEIKKLYKNIIFNKKQIMKGSRRGSNKENKMKL